jgi:hypothetical protein
MKTILVAAMCLWMAGCVSMTPEQRAAFAQAYLQNQSMQPPRQHYALSWCCKSTAVRVSYAYMA